MGHRLSKIYTRTGDDGSTGLGDGSRVPKNSPRVEAYGDVDELNSMIGLLLTESLPGHISDSLTDIQHDLFDVGGELSIPGQTTMTEKQVTRLEKTLDDLNAKLSPLKEFILPGGSRAAALCHIARTICRRAERRLITLQKSETISTITVKYVNRLSDLLFVIARALNASDGDGDVLWQPGKNR